MGSIGQPAIDGIERDAVESTNLASIGYDARRQILAIEFKSGIVFHYGSVPSWTVGTLLEAPSRGAFYAKEIRGKYPAQRMTGPCGKCGDEGPIGVTCTDCGTAAYQEKPRPPIAPPEHAES